MSGKRGGAIGHGSGFPLATQHIPPATTAPFAQQDPADAMHGVGGGGGVPVAHTPLIQVWVAAPLESAAGSQ